MFTIEDAQNCFSPIRNPRIKLIETPEGHWINSLGGLSRPKHYLDSYSGPIPLHRYLAWRAGLAELKGGRRINKCGVTQCCNPYHFAFKEAPAKRSRAKAGTMSIEDRQELRAAYALGQRLTDLARHYEIAYITAYHIAKGIGTYAKD